MNKKISDLDQQGSDSDDSLESAIEAAAAEAMSTLLPEKSRASYELSFQRFDQWLISKKIGSISEKIMLAYFLEKSKIMKPSTMWSEYSKLRTTIYLNKNEDISRYTSLIVFLKRKSEGYRGKKSKVFTKYEIDKFLTEANDDTYLMLKVLLIVGKSGACRRQELVQLSLKDVEDCGEFVRINILKTKTKVPREFTITGGSINELNLLQIFRKYSSLRSEKTPHQRFFVGYRNGKCTTQPVGINTIGTAPKKIATFLDLKNPEEYTGHCFRRSSATLLAESGADMAILKRHGGWKTTNVAEGYVDASVQNKRKIATMILGGNDGSLLKKIKTPEAEEESTTIQEDARPSDEIKLRKGVNLSHLKDCTKNVFNK